mgnify:FL=1
MRTGGCRPFERLADSAGTQKCAVGIPIENGSVRIGPRSKQHTGCIKADGRVNGGSRFGRGDHRSAAPWDAQAFSTLGRVWRWRLLGDARRQKDLLKVRRPKFPNASFNAETGAAGPKPGFFVNPNFAKNTRIPHGCSAGKDPGVGSAAAEPNIQVARCRADRFKSDF